VIRNVSIELGREGGRRGRLVRRPPTNSPLREDLLDVERFVAYLESEVEDLDALADAASGVPELAAVQSG
jgi:hypothetical protein